MGFRDVLIEDFTRQDFTGAFQLYFTELGIQVREWEKLFAEMNGQGNQAWLRLSETGEPVGFIQFTSIPFSSWFFEGKAGFIREFWIAKPLRNRGHGTALLSRAEESLKNQGLATVLLTTDTASGFYRNRGYRPDASILAKNGDPVFRKSL